MLKFLSTANCVPCSKTQPNVIHPIKVLTFFFQPLTKFRENPMLHPLQMSVENAKLLFLPKNNLNFTALGNLRDHHI